MNKGFCQNFCGFFEVVSKVSNKYSRGLKNFWQRFQGISSRRVSQKNIKHSIHKIQKFAHSCPTFYVSNKKIQIHFRRQKRNEIAFGRNIRINKTENRVFIP